MAKRTKAEWLADNLAARSQGDAIHWLEEQKCVSLSEIQILKELAARGMVNFKK